ncbi:MAG TPA: amino acid permease [Candidatus Acidoferrum sp.]|jgi:L-asparagine transporter-like permease|nr:amino acid permease [Candidatus Acidoferrum sp.]
MHEPSASEHAGASANTQETDAGSGSLQRRLTQRQLTMLALGGAIGVGLFLGSGITVQLAGPGVIVSYLIGAVIAMIVAYSLAEMAVVHPVSGAFGIYAETYLSKWVGFAVRATYGLVQIIAIGAEVTAVAIYFGFWFPHIPQWFWVLSASLALVAMNSVQVGRFGEFEYWFALIKVSAIIVFIGVGAALIFGFGPKPALGFSNLTAFGGFFPFGFKGVWLALTLALTSYMGVEVIAVTAGEARNPEESIPRAMRTIVFRLIFFYVLAIIAMLAMTPWNQLGSQNGIAGSPFVRGFSGIGIPYAATIMNLVVITAALSSCNTDLYLTTRMMFSLSRSGYAPDWIGRLGKNGVPHRALALSTLGMIAAILLAIYAPSHAFLTLYGVAVAGMFFVWIAILATHLRFRKSLANSTVRHLPIKLAFSPYSNWLGIGALLAIALTTFYVDGLRYSVPAFLPFLLVLSLMYWKSSQRSRKEKKT